MGNFIDFSIGGIIMFGDLWLWIKAQFCNHKYLVYVGRGFVTTDYWYCLKGKWQYWEGEVIAWCKLDDIEAYKGG